jgi:hypothetical protein
MIYIIKISLYNKFLTFILTTQLCHHGVRNVFQSETWQRNKHRPQYKTPQSVWEHHTNSNDLMTSKFWKQSMKKKKALVNLHHKIK